MYLFRFVPAMLSFAPSVQLVSAILVGTGSSPLLLQLLDKSTRICQLFLHCFELFRELVQASLLLAHGAIRIVNDAIKIFLQERTKRFVVTSASGTNSDGVGATVDAGAAVDMVMSTATLVENVAMDNVDRLAVWKSCLKAT